jgi:hypothetical protein
MIVNVEEQVERLGVSVKVWLCLTTPCGVRIVVEKSDRAQLNRAR